MLPFAWSITCHEHVKHNILKAVIIMYNVHTQGMIHLSCLAQHSSTRFPKLALVRRSPSSHQFLFSAFLPPTNSGSLCIFTAQKGIFQSLYTLACQEWCSTVTHLLFLLSQASSSSSTRLCCSLKRCWHRTVKAAVCFKTKQYKHTLMLSLPFRVAPSYWFTVVLCLSFCCQSSLWGLLTPERQRTQKTSCQAVKKTTWSHA